MENTKMENTKIKQKRKEKKISAEKIARILDISYVNYVNIEKGKTNTNILTALQISKILEECPHKLFSENNCCSKKKG